MGGNGIGKEGGENGREGNGRGRVERKGTVEGRRLREGEGGNE